MISHLSSFIQLLAAVYLTMCFDDTFFKGFWAREYVNPKLSELFGTSSVSELVQDRFYASIEKIKESEKRRMKMRGTYFFMLTVFLLIVIGFEKGIAAYTGVINLSYSYIGLAILLYAFYAADKFIINHWFWVYVFVFFLITGFCLAIFLIPAQSVTEDFAFKMKVTAKVFIVLALIVPVIWQLFTNWIYANTYHIYAISELTKESEKYNKAVYYNSKVDKMVEIDPCYQDLVARRLDPDTEDHSVDPFISVLDERISKSVSPILLTLLVCSRKELFKMFLGLFKGKENQVGS